MASQHKLSTAAIVALIVLICVTAICLFASVLQGDITYTQSSAASETSLNAPATEPNGSQDASLDATTSPSSAQSHTTTDDARTKEFAVDPTRTDWESVTPEQPTVYLTFDDGPSENTESVLAILDRYGIQATFFVTGINPDYLPMIATCHERGHTIGLHTYSHDYATVYASRDAYWSDLNAIGEAVRTQIGYVPCFIRFPGGSSNTISADYTQGIMSDLSTEVRDAGYQYFDWDASCGDGAVHTADELLAATQADTSYGYQSIVFLMHDGAGKETTVDALPSIIEYFQQQGYAFAAIDRHTPPAHHGIGN